MRVLVRMPPHNAPKIRFNFGGKEDLVFAFYRGEIFSTFTGRVKSYEQYWVSFDRSQTK